MKKISVFIISVLSPTVTFAISWASIKAAIGMSSEEEKNFRLYKESFIKKMEADQASLMKEVIEEEMMVLGAVDRYIEKNWPLSQQLAFSKCLQGK